MNTTTMYKKKKWKIKNNKVFLKSFAIFYYAHFIALKAVRPAVYSASLQENCFLFVAILYHFGHFVVLKKNGKL